jgi:hypothetical protein
MVLTLLQDIVKLMFEMTNASECHRDAVFVCGGDRSLSLPMLLAATTDVVALNFFFDTLLFCGAILLLSNSIDKEPAVPRI